jgi:hypothetical protein
VTRPLGPGQVTTCAGAYPMRGSRSGWKAPTTIEIDSLRSVVSCEIQSLENSLDVLSDHR